MSASTPSTVLHLDAALDSFGHRSFRPGQREAVETLLRERRLLLVAPTGGGKSLIYQLSAALLPGTSLVLSPLVALMHDQVEALTARGVAATYLAATLEPEELRLRLRRVAEGAYKLVYAAPERLAFEGFRVLLGKIDCPLIAVDEAHCISEWGHDFRPEYLQIGELVRQLPQARVLACTATATPVVRDEILGRLGLGADTPQLVRGFARPNLSLRVCETRSRRERDARLDAALAEALEAPGSARGTAIVYSPTRRLSEQEAARLASAGWRTGAYHAGMDGGARERVQHAFQTGALEVVVATNAFGMGIDRGDVRLVAHLAPPGSIEAYYQEVGRAGRDGADAIGVLAVSPGDLAVRRRLIEGSNDGRTTDPAVVRHKWNLFLELMRWAEGGSCRHDAILRYFGDDAETLAGCGRCDNCVALARDARGRSTRESRGLSSRGTVVDPAESAAESEEGTVVVRKALSAVARVSGRFGLQAAVKLLRGAADARLASAGLATTKTFGALSDRSDDWLTRLLRRCVTAGWVDFSGGDRPVVVLTDEGADVMHGRKPARVLMPPARSSSDARTSIRFGRDAVEGRDDGDPNGIEAWRSAGRARGSASDGGITEEALDEAGLVLFESLRRYRFEVSRREGIPPYMVASDKTLRDLAMLRPRDRDELLLVHGIGPAKAEKYGSGLLEVVAAAART